MDQQLTNEVINDSPGSRGEFKFYLPPGVKFNDMYMDAEDMTRELNYNKRTINNLRNEGMLSFTRPWGKIFYLRQEIARDLLFHTVLAKKKKRHERPVNQQP